MTGHEEREALRAVGDFARLEAPRRLGRHVPNPEGVEQQPYHFAFHREIDVLRNVAGHDEHLERIELGDHHAGDRAAFVEQRAAAIARLHGIGDLQARGVVAHPGGRGDHAGGEHALGGKEAVEWETIRHHLITRGEGPLPQLGNRAKRMLDLEDSDVVLLVRPTRRCRQLRAGLRKPDLDGGAALDDVLVRDDVAILRDREPGAHRRHGARRAAAPWPLRVDRLADAEQVVLERRIVELLLLVFSRDLGAHGLAALIEAIARDHVVRPLCAIGEEVIDRGLVLLARRRELGAARDELHSREQPAVAVGERRERNGSCAVLAGELLLRRAAAAEAEIHGGQAEFGKQAGELGTRPCGGSRHVGTGRRADARRRQRRHAVLRQAGDADEAHELVAAVHFEAAADCVIGLGKKLVALAVRELDEQPERRRRTRTGEAVDVDGGFVLRGLADGDPVDRVRRAGRAECDARRREKPTRPCRPHDAPRKLAVPG